MFIEKHQVSVTANTSGAATAYTSTNISGPIRAVRYVKTAGATGMASALSATVTNETTGAVIYTKKSLSATTMVYPVTTLNLSTGATATEGSAIHGLHVAANERVKISLTSAGNAKVGTFWIYVG